MCNLFLLLLHQLSLRLSASASESRQTSFLAIANHEVDKKHWFRLGRSLTKLNGSKGLVYWNAVPLLTQTYEGTVSFQIFGLDNDIKLVDLADGSIYELPDEMINNMGDGETQLVNLPITDTPKLITFGNFID